jgi:signal transduction histidine kinase
MGAVDLQEVVDSTLRMAANHLKQRARVVRAYEEVPPVRGSATRLGQVVLNLVINAAHALPEERASDNQLTVTLRQEESAAKLAISDTGCGIPEDVLPRIFDPFFTTRASTGGTGLGLSLCRTIVTSFGGNISVRSEVGKGTTVEVALPYAGQRRPNAA